MSASSKRVRPGDIITIRHESGILHSKPLYHLLSVNEEGIPTMSGNAGDLPGGKTALVVSVYTSPGAPQSRKVTLMYIINENSQGWTWVSSDVEVISV